jgi:hypothetical protein
MLYSEEVTAPLNTASLNSLTSFLSSSDLSAAPPDLRATSRHATGPCDRNLATVMRHSKFKIHTECRRWFGEGRALPGSASSPRVVDILNFAFCILAVLGLTAAVSAREEGQYRDFCLGASLTSVSAQIGAPTSGVALTHERRATRT